ncbi:flavin-containing monooxygenase [Dietzia lutea]|uniref:FAD-containing monooxygenase EthA n=1 Tax=Dietzia lutea TaxID=546160 RepID=A0A2S1R3R3_9ACTN|nr:NAD(P)/FAD-dependent oxidoreductase [Dietzia lutea]AWH90929.1 FAD-containing monooxygenase EthA [Dietzia lutea]
MNTYSPIEHIDVAIVGAGISGIAAAVQLKQSRPHDTFALLEMRDNIGGTWDLFRYPGVRSDSDMFTLGYGFKPWTAEKSIAAGSSIREYLHETVKDHGLESHLRTGHRLLSAEWNSDQARWTLQFGTPNGERLFSCRFLYMAAGYYSYESAFNPKLAGEDRFQGRLVHAQFWPEDLDYAGKRVAIIGSGATAITLLPTMAQTTAMTTMIQRSPGYVHIETDAVDIEAKELRQRIGETEAFTAIRMRNLENQQLTYKLARENPEAYKKSLFDAIESVVGREIREKHFTPKYEPWDQRVCLVPNADLFEAIRDGRGAVATGTIASVTETGVLMDDGEHIDADIIVKATGLNVVFGGDAKLRVDGADVSYGERWTYKGIGLSGVPNFVFAWGFLNSSWTLRIELLNEFWCRMLDHLEATGTQSVTPVLRPADTEMQASNFVHDVTSGYLQRGFATLPRQGDQTPWVNPQNYEETRRLLTEDVEDGVLQFR